jgi:uncharacterized repeat protein (TIGR03943 family)
VTSRTQGIALALMGVVLIRLSVTGEYLRFVTPWMRWPLLGAGLVLVVLAARPLFGAHPGPARDSTDTSHETVPRSAWLLLVPTLVVFAVAPPPLGAYLAERRADQAVTLREPDVVRAPAGDGPLPLAVGEFQWGASQPDDPIGLAGREVELSGFVSRDDKGWYVTDLEVFCCAADAMVMRARVQTDGVAPARDEWVKVVGTWVEGTGSGLGDPPVLAARTVRPIDQPRNPYAG